MPDPSPTPGALPCCRGDNMREVYYGWRCTVCDTFYAAGCEPWAPLDDDWPWTPDETGLEDEPHA